MIVIPYSASYLGRNDKERLDVELGENLVPLAAVAAFHLELPSQLHEGGASDVHSSAKIETRIRIK